MHTEVTIRDQISFNPQQGDYVFTLHFPAAQITVRELIRTRVFQEVQSYNARQPTSTHILVHPTDTERRLNPVRPRKARLVDWENQFEKAIDSFKGNGFIILVNDKQVEGLDEKIEITPQTQVTFLKLIPLVGG